MALKITRSPQARRDLIEIWNYIADDNPVSADKVLRKIGRVLQTVSDNPESGRLRPELRSGIRSFPTGNYVVFYRLTEDAVEVVRIRSRYMDTAADDQAETE